MECFSISDENNWYTRISTTIDLNTSCVYVCESSRDFFSFLSLFYFLLSLSLKVFLSNFHFCISNHSSSHTLHSNILTIFYKVFPSVQNIRSLSYFRLSQFAKMFQRRNIALSISYIQRPDVHYSINRNTVKQLCSLFLMFFLFFILFSFFPFSASNENGVPLKCALYVSCKCIIIL